MKHPTCFLPGTLVATPLGSVPIDTLRVGDQVLTYDRKRREVVQGTVERTLRYRAKGYGVLALVDGTEIGATPDHPFYSVTRKAWVYTEDLEPGEIVYKLQNLALKAVAVRRFTASADTADVLNLTVAGHHTYFAEGVLVHNCGDSDAE